jgi:HNH endonuclease
MKEIPLHNTEGTVIAHAVVDDEDFDLVKGSSWSLGGKPGYQYVQAKRGGEEVYLHRFLLGLVPGDGRKVDHKDGDRLNNTRANLRLCPNGQRDNLQNRARLSTNNTSGYRGVSYEARKGNYKAYVMIDGRQKHLGYFTTPEEAGVAAREFRAQHMPFAKEAA